VRGRKTENVQSDTYVDVSIPPSVHPDTVMPTERTKPSDGFGAGPVHTHEGWLESYLADTFTLSDCARMALKAVESVTTHVWMNWPSPREPSPIDGTMAVVTLHAVGCGMS
jgi:hypothetical protein